jgi:hypothetical protein
MPSEKPFYYGALHLAYFSPFPEHIDQIRASEAQSLTDSTAEQLMQAVAGGDLDAFSELVPRYQALAWKTAYRFFGDAMESEDITQECGAWNPTLM